MVKRNEDPFTIEDQRPIGEHPLQPGEMCCLDQMVAGCLGLPYTMHGRQSQCRYTCCTFFVDIATHHILPHFQETTNAIETLTGKQRYEGSVIED